MFKSIKLLKKLKLRQEILFTVCLINSKNRERTDSKIMNEFASINNTIHKLRDKIPFLYVCIFILFKRHKKLHKKCRICVLEEFGLDKEEYKFYKL